MSFQLWSRTLAPNSDVELDAPGETVFIRYLGFSDPNELGEPSVYLQTHLIGSPPRRSYPIRQGETINVDRFDRVTVASRLGQSVDFELIIGVGGFVAAPAIDNVRKSLQVFSSRTVTDTNGNNAQYGHEGALVGPRANRTDLEVINLGPFTVTVFAGQPDQNGNYGVAGEIDLGDNVATYRVSPGDTWSAGSGNAALFAVVRSNCPGNDNQSGIVIKEVWLA